LLWLTWEGPQNLSKLGRPKLIEAKLIEAQSMTFIDFHVDFTTISFTAWSIQPQILCHDQVMTECFETISAMELSTGMTDLRIDRYDCHLI
jgi:hypothetical protein